MEVLFRMRVINVIVGEIEEFLLKEQLIGRDEIIEGVSMYHDDDIDDDMISFVIKKV